MIQDWESDQLASGALSTSLKHLKPVTKVKAEPVPATPKSVKSDRESSKQKASTSPLASRDQNKVTTKSTPRARKLSESPTSTRHKPTARLDKNLGQKRTRAPESSSATPGSGQSSRKRIRLQAERKPESPSAPTIDQSNEEIASPIKSRGRKPQKPRPRITIEIPEADINNDPGQGDAPAPEPQTLTKKPRGRKRKLVKETKDSSLDQSLPAPVSNESTQGIFDHLEDLPAQAEEVPEQPPVDSRPADPELANDSAVTNFVKKFFGYLPTEQIPETSKEQPLEEHQPPKKRRRRRNGSTIRIPRRRKLQHHAPEEDIEASPPKSTCLHSHRNGAPVDPDVPDHNCDGKDCRMMPEDSTYTKIIYQQDREVQKLKSDKERLLAFQKKINKQNVELRVLLQSHEELSDAQARKIGELVGMRSNWETAYIQQTRQKQSLEEELKHLQSTSGTPPQIRQLASSNGERFLTPLSMDSLDTRDRYDVLTAVRNALRRIYHSADSITTRPMSSHKTFNNAEAEKIKSVAYSLIDSLGDSQESVNESQEQ